MTDTNSSSDTVIVLDFETTGLSPDCGDRAIEIGAVKLVNGQLVDRFQQLMNPGKRISSFIEDYTGITNNMLKKAPPCDEVMSAFSEFIDGFNLVAHNASFDSRFLDAELNRIKAKQAGEFACSMLIARRVYPDSPNHKLGTLVRYKSLPNDGTFHRALADAEMTTHLWVSMMNDIKENHAFDDIPFNIMQKLSRTSKQAVSSFLARESNNH
ncbi:MAG: 3'-5' exonuclease [Gammaproteobacteria bacterium]|nr:3'-5' exonuclease [Gammaproteobacteria bacterium]